MDKPIQYNEENVDVEINDNIEIDKEIYNMIISTGANIERTDLGLSINLSEKEDNEIFMKKLLNEINKGGYYIENINIFGIMECINNSQKKIILGAGFKKFDSYEKEIYESKLKIEPNCVKFDFFVTYDEETDTEFNADYDKLMMILLQNGIMSGINFLLINNIINGFESKSVQIVAESEEVQEVKDGIKKTYPKYLKGLNSGELVKEENIVRNFCSKNDSDNNSKTYIEKTALGLAINLSKETNNKLFVEKLLNEIYMSGYCIQDINVSNILECVNNGQKSLILGNGLKEFNSDEKELYNSKLRIKGNIVKFDFFVTYNEETATEFNADYDKLIMILLQNGIISGINYDLIKITINGLESKSVKIIAEI